MNLAFNKSIVRSEIIISDHIVVWGELEWQCFIFCRSTFCWSKPLLGQITRKIWKILLDQVKVCFFRNGERGAAGHFIISIIDMFHSGHALLYYAILEKKWPRRGSHWIYQTKFWPLDKGTVLIILFFIFTKYLENHILLNQTKFSSKFFYLKNFI